MILPIMLDFIIITDQYYLCRSLAHVDNFRGRYSSADVKWVFVVLFFLKMLMIESSVFIHHFNA